jgi:beta-glucanase (GH16 family)
MKCLFFLSGCLLLLSLSSCSPQANTKIAGSKWQLVWSDEFNRNGPPDSTNWRFEKGFVRNNELQWYQHGNARCKGGYLVIEARKETRPNPNFEAGSQDWRKRRPAIEYTSSSLRTNPDLTWKYGRFEMRARIDTSRGLWPAWWTLGVKGEWPSNGEIDIMEFYRGKILANIATGTDKRYKAHWYGFSKPVSEFKKGWAKKFHIWRMDWNENEIALYVDDTLLNRVAMKDLVNKDGSGINPFMQHHYMLLNLAVGGDNGGDPSKTTFPRKYEIDYVRVYKEKEK